jgi:hypothetical protein
MILLIQDRKDNYHIADYQTASGTKYTVCGLVYSKKYIINTFSLDSSIRIACPKCSSSLEQSNQYMQNNHLRQHYDKLESNLKHRYSNIQNGMLDTEMEFDDMSDRFWDKLYHYKRLSKRNHDYKCK